MLEEWYLQETVSEEKETEMEFEYIRNFAGDAPKIPGDIQKYFDDWELDRIW